ncbi:uncharacterized protein LOC135498224 [Lineus longissimus]|uniref:uncharacterized protein LOC135498224 n=1 Tax=Lineus longissimus TaxID=88925 RepID=UPI00315C8E67
MSGRKRSENFTPDQRRALIELLRAHEDIVEDKRTDVQANKRKQAAWEKIAGEMNALFPERPPCASKDLKDLWRRMKIKAKAVAREKKIDLGKTGGGTATVGEVDDEILAILNIIPGDLQQLHNPVDDDAPSVPVVADDLIDEPLPSTSADDLGSCTPAAETFLKDVDGEVEYTGGNYDLHNSSAATPRKPRSSKSLEKRATMSDESPVLKKTDQALAYLKDEHEQKMSLLNLQQAAKFKKRAYEAKMDYYKEKIRKHRIDL